MGKKRVIDKLYFCTQDENKVRIMLTDCEKDFVDDYQERLETELGWELLYRERIVRPLWMVHLWNARWGIFGFLAILAYLLLVPSKG